MKTLKRKMLAFIMTCVMVISTGTVTFAAENVEDTVDAIESTQSVYIPLYNNDPVRGTVGDVLVISRGTYNFAYSVTIPGTFGYFVDGNYGGSFNISGTNEITLRLPLGMTQWYFIPNNQNIEYSYAFTIYN